MLAECQWLLASERGYIYHQCVYKCVLHRLHSSTMSVYICVSMCKRWLYVYEMNTRYTYVCVLSTNFKYYIYPRYTYVCVYIYTYQIHIYIYYMCVYVAHTYIMHIYAGTWRAGLCRRHIWKTLYIYGKLVWNGLNVCLHHTLMVILHARNSNNNGVLAPGLSACVGAFWPVLMKARWHHDGFNDSNWAFVLPAAVNSGMSNADQVRQVLI